MTCSLRFAVDWGTDLVFAKSSTTAYMSSTHSSIIFSHNQKSQNSIPRKVLVNWLHTGMYWHVHCTYWYIPVEHVCFLGNGPVFYCLGATIYSSYTPSITPQTASATLVSLPTCMFSIIPVFLPQ